MLCTCDMRSDNKVESNQIIIILSSCQRLAGATLLVFANKQDLPGALSKEAIREVRFVPVANTATRSWFDSGWVGFVCLATKI